MIIVTDLLIIDHLISVSYFTVFILSIQRPQILIPFLILNLNKYNLLPNVVSKIAGWVANSVDPYEMLRLRRLIWIYTIAQAWGYFFYFSTKTYVVGTH